MNIIIKIMDQPIRKTNRLKEYNYGRNGGYFITICTDNHRNIFWKPNLIRVFHNNGNLLYSNDLFSQYGLIVEKIIQSINESYKDIIINKYVIMPNHMHMIIFITNDEKQSNILQHANERIPSLVSTLKRFSNKECGFSMWQRSYYDHVIRDQKDYENIWQYIEDNPIKWLEDEYYRENE